MPLGMLYGYLFLDYKGKKIHKIELKNFRTFVPLSACHSAHVKERIGATIEYTPIRVKINTKLTDFMKLMRIE